MRSGFEEANLFAYYALLNGVLDVLLWCLGPYVDDTREYPLYRYGLARVTRRACEVWLLVRDIRRPRV